MRIATAATLAGTLCVTSVRAELLFATWNGPSGGAWGVPANWSPQQVPLNTAQNSFSVTLPAATTVSFDATGSIDDLSIGSNGTLTVLNSRSLTIDEGPLVSEGVLHLAANGTQTRLRFQTELILQGGHIQMGPGSGARIRTQALNGRLVVNGDATISGVGNIGDSSPMRLTNSGTITATGPGELRLKLAGAFVENQNWGELRADGGTLLLDATGVDNTGASDQDGRIVAGPGSTVTLYQSTVRGGTLEAEPGGTLGFTSTNALIAVAIEGNSTVATGATLSLTGACTNSGIMTVGSNAGTASIAIPSNTSLGGGGVLKLGASVDNKITSASPGMVLTNQRGHTIRGSGQIGIGNYQFVHFHNEGVVEATNAVPLRFWPGVYWPGGPPGGQATSTNTGTLRATGGGVLEIAKTGFDNSGGEIVAQDGSQVWFTFSGSNVLGGVLRSEGTGTIWVDCQTSFYGTNFDGQVAIVPGGSVFFEESFSNDGVISLISEPRQFAPFLWITSDLTIGGHGSIVLEAIPNTQIYADGATLTNGPDHTIRGAGLVASHLTNLGSVVSDALPGLTFIPFRQVRNFGSIRIAPSSIALLQGSLVENHGQILIDAGGIAKRTTGTIVQQKGMTRVDGALVLEGGSFIVGGGDVEGSGSISGTLENGGGRLRPAGGAVGTLAINGLLQASASTGSFEVQFAGPPASNAFDRLAVSGAAHLGGTLSIARTMGYQQSAGDSFTILTAGSRIGTFAAIDSCDDVEISYLPDGVVVTFLRDGLLLGDLDGNGAIDGVDLGLLLGSWGACSEFCCAADLNDDGEVDASDIQLLLTNWSDPATKRRIERTPPWSARSSPVRP